MRNRLEMACHNQHCYSADYLDDTPKAGMEKEYEEAAAEVKMLKVWLIEFTHCHNHAKCTASIAIASLNVIDKSILKMAGGGIADKDKGMYLRAYSDDIRAVMECLKGIGE